MKKVLAIFLSIIMVFTGVNATNIPVELASPSAILMDLSGNIIFEKNAHEKREPASVTKIMTMLLVMESIESGKISYDDMVVISAEAESQGGTQVFLEAGEIMSVDDLLKSVAVSSANDAAVALGEYISGSHDAFVDLMNETAQRLGMENTVFKNATGLPEDGHETTAFDISLMSRELLKYEDIKNYTTIWTDSIRGGEFELANTNKLLKTYNGMTGLKTGYTSTAKYCISSTAKRNDEEFLAVVMGAESTDARNADIVKMLDFAFTNYKTQKISDIEIPNEIAVINGKEDTVSLILETKDEEILTNSKAVVEYGINLEESVTAPIEQNQVLGSVDVLVDGELLRKINILAGETIEEREFFDVLIKFIISFFMNKL